MNNYEFYNLVISLFTALGTCGATILALCFWLNDKQIKLKVRSMHADSYGNFPQIEGGYFAIILTNTGYYPLRVEIAGLKAYKKSFLSRKMLGYLLFENTQFDSLPKNLQHGESYAYIVPMDEMRNKLTDFNKNVKVKLFVGIASARHDMNYSLDKNCKDVLLGN